MCETRASRVPVAKILLDKGPCRGVALERSICPTKRIAAVCKVWFIEKMTDRRWIDGLQFITIDAEIMTTTGSS